jgi:hypothetical protein
MTEKSVALPPQIVKKFTLDTVRVQFVQINQEVNDTYQTPFPKQRSRLISWYEYQHLEIEWDENGQVKRGIVWLVAALFDFTFVRSVAAPAYGKEGGYCYDPVSLFLLHLFAFLDGYMDDVAFVRDLRDPEKGKTYRTLAGLQERIPSEDDLCNFRYRLQPEHFNIVFHVLDWFFEKIGLITGVILSTDGLLVRTFARYLGCNYAEERCRALPYTPEIRALIKERVTTALAVLAQGVSTKEIRIFVPCPHPEIVEKVKEKTKGKTPLFEVVCLRFIHTRYTTTFQMAGHPLEKTVALLTEGQKKETSPDGRSVLKALLDEELPIAEGIRVQAVTNNVHWEAAGQPTIRCSKVPADIRARLGYRRSKSDPTKAEAVFGWEMMTTVSIEPLIHREFPVGVAVGVPNTSVGERFKVLQTEQVEKHHSFTPLAHTGDCAFGTEPGMAQVRSKGAVPIMDYNPGREDLSPEKLLERGYDKKGWPYITCPGGTRWAIPPVRHEQETKSILHACLQLCPQKEQESPCSFRETGLGQCLGMSIEEHPRLVVEVPRGTEQFQLLRNLRSGSERFNSQGKDDGRLETPRLMGEHAFGVRANLGTMTVLLKKTLEFILEMTAQLPHISAQSVPDHLRGPPMGEFLNWLRLR